VPCWHRTDFRLYIQIIEFCSPKQIIGFPPPNDKILTFGGGGKGERYRVKTSGGSNGKGGGGD
jgi:hypothetical protein